MLTYDTNVLQANQLKGLTTDQLSLLGTQAIQKLTSDQVKLTDAGSLAGLGSSRPGAGR